MLTLHSTSNATVMAIATLVAANKAAANPTWRTDRPTKRPFNQSNSNFYGQRPILLTCQTVESSPLFTKNKKKKEKKNPKMFEIPTSYCLGSYRGRQAWLPENMKSVHLVVAMHFCCWSFFCFWFLTRRHSNGQTDWDPFYLSIDIVAYLRTPRTKRSLTGD